ncbi:MAG TPA: response regulator [Candidatus Dormibacteraeota bacterium]
MPARILLIDDTEISLQLARYLLERSGHVVLLARDGREGLGVASRELPDLILTDLRMSGMDGAQLCLALIDDPRLVAIPRVAVTAHATAAAAEDIMSQGFTGYIPKPIEVVSFVRQVEDFLPDGLR